VFGGWLNWPHLAQLESGVGGAAASPGPVRVWGGWGDKPVEHRLISACLCSCHVFNLCNQLRLFNLLPACVFGGAPKKAHCGRRLGYKDTS